MREGMIRTLMASLSILLAAPLAAQPLPPADISIAQYEEETTLDRTKFYLHGVETGLKYAIIINKLNGLPIAYCQPEDTAHTTLQLVNLIDEELRLFPELNANRQAPVAIILLRALQRTYPCGAD